MTDEKKTDQKKHEEQLAQLGKTLRSAIPPLGETQPQRDLWPRAPANGRSAEDFRALVSSAMDRRRPVV